MYIVNSDKWVAVMICEGLKNRKVNACTESAQARYNKD